MILHLLIDVWGHLTFLCQKKIRKNIKNQRFQSTGEHPKGEQELEKYLLPTNHHFGVQTKQNKTMNLGASGLGDFCVPKFQQQSSTG